MEPQNLINHFVFLLDASGSMKKIRSQVIRVFDSQIKRLAERSAEVQQETRVSVFKFSDHYDVKCIVYDKDVLRLPSIDDLYICRGQTALIDAQLLAIEDLSQTYQKYGDHAFLFYTLTDGGENDSVRKAPELARKFQTLPDNYTSGILVPDEHGVFEAKRHGFPAGNVRVWSTTDHGIAEVGNTITQTSDTFFQNRSRGIRGTKTLFVDAANIRPAVVRENLNEVTNCTVKVVPFDMNIREFVEKYIGVAYISGNGFYQLTKTEEVQSYKEICILDKVSGKIYEGAHARNMLGLPDRTMNVRPGNFGQYTIFVQSTSAMRKLIGGTTMLYFRNS